MKLGLSSYTYTWAFGVPGRPQPAVPMSPFDLLTRARELGVGLVQLADNGPLDELSGAELARFAASARDAGIDVEVGTRGIHPNHLARQLEIATLVGSPIVRIVVDTKDDHPSPERVVAELSGQRTRFERAGIMLAIENHDRFSAGTLAGIVRSLGRSWVGICLDTVNSFGSMEGPQVVVDTLGPLAINLHIKDFTIRRADHAMGFAIDGTPAGDGMLDVPWLLAELRGYGRELNGILELWTPPEDTIEATVAKEAAWAEQSVRYLRSLIPD